MKYDNMTNLIKDKEIVIPIYIYKIFPKLKIDLESFIFLMYLRSKGNLVLFDVNNISSELGIDIKEIMKYMSTLESNKLVELKVVKNDKNIMEEFISLDLFYEKLSMYVVEKLNEKKEDNSIFKVLESELGKTLTPMEMEIVKAWKESNYSDDIIREAIKEAVYNGVANLRYIDKILYNWSKEGVKTLEDVEKSRKNFRDKAKENEKENKKQEIFDYDWMNDSSEN